MRRRIRGMVPYDLGAPLLARLWSQPPVQRLALGRLRRRFPAHPLYADEQDLLRGERLQRHLASHTFRKWREYALDACSDRSFARWVRFEGTGHVEAALAAGSGLILAGSHHGSAQTLKILLARFGLDVVTLAGGRDRGTWQHARMIWVGDMQDEQDLLRSMVAMRRVLKQRGIVHVPADSRRVGRSGLEVGFLGHRRRFAYGFAVLALTARVPVVPVFALVETDGRITVRFEPALAPPQQGTREQRLEGLVRQYVDRLERFALDYPELTPPRYADWLTRLPVAEAPRAAERSP